MPATFPVQFLAADRPFYEGECVSLVLPTINRYVRHHGPTTGT